MKDCDEVLREIELYLDRELDETVCVEIERHLTGCGTCLPAVIMPRGPQQVHAELGAARHQELRIEIACIHNVDLRQQPLLKQGAVNARSDFAVGGRRCGRLDVGDQVRRVVFTGFCQMHLVAHPAGGVLPAKMGIRVERRTHKLGCFGDSIVSRPPAHACFCGQVVLQPDASKRIHRRYFPQPGRSVDRIHCREQGLAITADCVRQL